jgi:hypothetical protein
VSEPTALELEERQNSYEAGYITGWAEQRERIIALLEAWVANDNGDFDVTLALISENEPSIIQDKNLIYIMGDDK